MNNIENIWYQYHKKLLSFIKLKVDNDVAEDILQDVFIKIHRQIGSLNEGKKLESWLFQITRNTIIDYYRSKKTMEALPEWLEQKEYEESRRELSLCLEPMVKTLPDKYQKAIQLSELEGRTQQEVAELEGISLSGAKSRIQRGRILLKEILNSCCQLEMNNNNQLVSYEKKGGKCDIC